MANKKTVKKVTKKPTTKKTTAKKTTTKKTVKPVAKKVVKEEVIKEVKVPEVKEKTKRSKKVLIVGLLYFLCSLVWIIGGTSKILVKESGILDILVGVFLVVIAIIYFVRFAKNKELK